MMRSKSATWNMALPLYRDVVFVDWHGVMSDKLFWSTFVASDDGRSIYEVEQAVTRLFANESLVSRWMRGAVSTREIVETDFLENPPTANEAARLTHWLVAECEAAKTDRWMTASIRRLRHSQHVVLATDNMDCFVDGIQTRGDLSALFDDYISSSEVGVLKAEDPAGFFGRWMGNRDIDPSRSVLIDDSTANCRSFETLGGRAINFGGPESMAKIYELLWPAACA